MDCVYSTGRSEGLGGLGACCLGGLGVDRDTQQLPGGSVLICSQKVECGGLQY